MLKRYILFTFGQYTLCSGWHGAVGCTIAGTPPESFDTSDEALERGMSEKKKSDGFGEPLFIQVVDLHTGLIVHEKV